MRIVGASTKGGSQPGQPSIGIATNSGDASTVNVSFSIPTYKGKTGAVTEYVVTSSPGSFTSTGTFSPIKISGLSSGTNYTFNVKANTSYGVSGISSSNTNSISPGSNNYWFLKQVPLTGSNSGNYSTTSMFTDSSGNVYAAGQIKDGSSYGYLTLSKHNSSGILQWNKRFVPDQITFFDIQCNGITVDSSGNIYAVGNLIQNSNTESWMFLMKFNSSGTLLWQKQFKDTASFSIVKGNGITTDNSYLYIGGESSILQSGTSSYVGVVLKYDLNGNFQWSRQVQKNNSYQTSIYDIAIDSSSNIYISGAAYVDSWHSFLMKFNSSGTELWERQIYDANDIYSRDSAAMSVTIDSNNNCYIGGYFKNLSQGLQPYLIKYNSSGTLQWQRILSDTVNSDQLGRIWSIKAHTFASSLIYVYGTIKAQSKQGNNAFILCYQDNGTLAWQRYIYDAYNVTNTYYGTFGSGNHISGHQSNIIVGSSYYNNSIDTSFILKVASNDPATGAFELDSYPGTRFNFEVMYCTESSGSLTDTATSVIASGSSTIYESTTASFTEVSSDITSFKVGFN